MAGASPRVDGPKSKRRKVRKGTQSCWECRRRKVRCIFAETADAICQNCRRRGTACVSQEHPDEPMPSANSNQVEERLGRVEALVERLLDSAVPSASSSYSDRNIEPVFETTRLRSPLKRSSPTTTTSPVRSKRGEGTYEELSRLLTASWPSQSDIDHICALPVGISAHLHSGICIPYSSFVTRDLPSPQTMLQLPPPGSHPVLIARKLLVLGIFLQGVVPSSIQELGNLGTSYRDIMSRVVDTAIRLVTTNEDLIRSVEGIECIMIEAMYQNYAGNLHRAWMAVRRAITVAQVMALHRGLNSASLKILEPETRAAFDPDQVCFRLMDMDRYLSLMLGLPRTSLEAGFATPQALEACPPIDRMQRTHCAMADRILDRDENNLSETHAIDATLHKAAADMPPQWWLIPFLSPSSNSATEVLHETIRLMDQFTHYHLLIRLHLPYMLRALQDRRYDHSKITAVNVSRETLARFVAFRTSNPAHYYCRGTDFLAFIATTVLCLSHIDSRSQSKDSTPNSDASTVFNFIVRSRPTDRGMMERSLDIMESMTRADTDAIAPKIARILRPLLAIEANSASGTIYSINSSNGDDGELGYHGKLNSGGKGLYIHIPYFGTINFQRQAISTSIPTEQMSSDQGIPTALVPGMLLPNQLDQHNQQPPSSGDQLDGYNTQNAQLQLGQLSSPAQPASLDDDFSNFGINNTQQGQLPFSVDLTGTEDEWDLQGIDVALFNSLFCESANLDFLEQQDSGL